MSFWLVSVPVPKSGPGVVAELQAATQGNAAVNAFDLPALKVGTLDQLMALRSEQRNTNTRQRKKHCEGGVTLNDERAAPEQTLSASALRLLGVLIAALLFLCCLFVVRFCTLRIVSLCTLLRLAPSSIAAAPLLPALLRRASLPLCSEDTLKMDTFVGGVAKKIEKTYYEVWKTEAAEVAANKERAAAAAPAAQAASSSSSSAASKEEKAPELRIENSQ